MKRILWIASIAALLLTVVPQAGAQDCSSLNKWDLRGTYTFSGIGWMELSRAFPPPAPAGFSPLTAVGAWTFNGKGEATGWVAFNIGGNLINGQYVNMTYTVNTDCSLVLAFSMRIKELGIVGPYVRIGVVSGKPDALEFHFIMGGTPIGSPGGAQIDLGTARRVSLQY